MGGEGRITDQGRTKSLVQGEGGTTQNLGKVNPQLREVWEGLK